MGRWEAGSAANRSRVEWILWVSRCCWTFQCDRRDEGVKDHLKPRYKCVSPFPFGCGQSQISSLIPSQHDLFAIFSATLSNSTSFWITVHHMFAELCSTLPFNLRLSPSGCAAIGTKASLCPLEGQYLPSQNTPSRFAEGVKVPHVGLPLYAV